MLVSPIFVGYFEIFRSRNFLCRDKMSELELNFQEIKSTLCDASWLSLLILVILCSNSFSVNWLLEVSLISWPFSFDFAEIVCNEKKKMDIKTRARYIKHYVWFWTSIIRNVFSTSYYQKCVWHTYLTTLFEGLLLLFHHFFSLFCSSLNKSNKSR